MLAQIGQQPRKGEILREERRDRGGRMPQDVWTDWMVVGRVVSENEKTQEWLPSSCLEQLQGWN